MQERKPAGPDGQHDARASQIVPMLMLALVMLLWSGNFIVGRAVRHDIPPFTLSLGRWLIATLLLAPFAARGIWRERAEIVRGWRWIVVLGVLGVAAFNGLLYSGLSLTSATNALLLDASIPALVLLFDYMLFRSRSSVGQLLGVCISILGVLVIVCRGDAGLLASLKVGAGDALVLSAMVAWALYTVLLRKKPPISALSFLAVTFALGAAAMAPLAAREWAQGLAVNWHAGTLAAFVYVGVLPSVVAYFIYNRATAQLGAAKAGQAITLLPVFGALLSATLLGERLEGYHILGIGLILLGIIVPFGAFWRRARRPVEG